MPQLQQPFDARSVEPSQGFQPFPYADYRVMIVGSEMKQTNAQDGWMLIYTLRVIEGQFINRELPYRLNLYNKNQQTCEIAFKELSALGHVTGVLQIINTEDLHGKDFIATIGPQKDAPQYSEVKAVKDRNGVLPGKAGAQPVAAAAPPTGPAPVAAQPAYAAPAAAPTYAPPAYAAAPQPTAAAAPAYAAPQTPAPANAAPPWGAPQVPAQAPVPANGAPAGWSPNTPPAAAPSWGK